MIHQYIFITLHALRSGYGLQIHQLKKNRNGGAGGGIYPEDPEFQRIKNEYI